MSDFEQWNGLVGQLAMVRAKLLEVGEESEYYLRAKSYAKTLMQMIKDAWLTNVLKPVNVESKEKGKGGRVRVPYISNEADKSVVVERMAKIIKERLVDEKIRLVDGSLMRGACFFAYVYSAMSEAGVPENDELKAFWYVVEEAAKKSDVGDAFKTNYNAIYDVVKKWLDVSGSDYPYGYVRIGELSVAALDDDKKKRKLVKYKCEYEKVVEVLREEGLVEDN